MKKLIIFQGLPGVGKSHLSNLLASKIDVKRVDRDEIKSEIINEFASSEDPYCRAEKYRLMATERFFQAIESYLAEHDSVILDSLIPTEEYLKLFYNRFPDSNFHYLVIEIVNSNKDSWKERFERRDHLANQVARKFEEITNISGLNKIEGAHLQIDSNIDNEISLNTIEKFVTR